MWSMFTPSMRKRACRDISKVGISERGAYHPLPPLILRLPLPRLAHPLRLMQTKQTIIELPHNALRRQNVIEQPLLAQLADVGFEDGGEVGAEGGGLVHCYERVFDGEGVECEGAGCGGVSEVGGVVDYFGVEV